MKYTVYILKSTKTGNYYVGQTQDLTKRLYRHNHGQNKSTKKGMPWICVHAEHYKSRSEAFQREQQIKRYKGGEAFKKLVI